MAFLVAVLGSWTRINGAGMACPDWPLCKGLLVPELRGGVILEWTHRLFVLLESLLLLGVFAAGWRARKSAAGIGRGLAVLAVVFLVQVVLGGVTVQLGNSPVSVVWHWGMAMALLATLTVLALLTYPRGTALAANGRAAGALAVAAGSTLVARCLGAFVSSSNAGLACATFPLCDGGTLGVTPPQIAQMLHRAAATLVVISALVAVFVARGAPSRRVRRAAFAGCALAVVQFGLGAANVFAAMPTALREVHAANAVVTFLAFVVGTACGTLDAAPEPLPLRVAREVSTS